MLVFRRTLALLSLAGALFLGVTLKTESWHLSDFEIWTAAIVGIALTANFIYMIQAPTHEPRTRLGRMWRLWWDAKEAELASRARSPDSGSSASPQGKN